MLIAAKSVNQTKSRYEAEPESLRSETLPALEKE
jgi:hypothetical protein